MLYQIIDGTVSLGGETILSHFNFEIKQNDKIAVVGRNGSGKTTLLNVISGMDSYEEGEIIIEGKSMNDFTKEQIEDYRRAYEKFGIKLQDYFNKTKEKQDNNVVYKYRVILLFL